jgi:phosphotransferase system HPr (HPr) family protein
MIERDFVLENKVGLHARPAAKLVEAAGKFSSKIMISYNGKEANARSILKVLALGAEHGARINVRIEGEDEGEAVRAIEELVANRFYED